MKTGKSIAIVIAAVVIAAVLVLSFGLTSAKTETQENHKIGVIVYDINDSEVQMFRGYYENYISDNFPVEFIYSASISDWNDEKSFIEDAAAQGAEGFISFYATDLKAEVELCEELKVYYMMGSGNTTDELFAQVANNPYFLGCIGPDDDTDYQAGADMVNAYTEAHGTEPAQIIVTTGGSGNGNHMHEMRAKGILETLAKTYGFTYYMDTDAMITASEPFEYKTGIDGLSIVICPGYDVQTKLETSLNLCDADAVLSVLGSDSIAELVSSAEAAEGHDIWLGLVDCFSQWNYELFNTEDAYGNSKLNYLSGKYASEIGPTFAAMFEAITDGTQNLRQNGKAFRLNQGFWTADSTEEFNSLYAYTQSYALNAYSSADLMTVISAYSDTADFSSFKKLTEAYGIEEALKRMGM